MDVRKIAREIVENSAVLLKNEGGMLPFDGGKPVAVFGRAQTESVISGNGSGAASGEKKTSILDACVQEGLPVVSGLAEFYRRSTAEAVEEKGEQSLSFEKLKELVHSGAMYEFFGKYSPPAEEFAVPGELLREAAGETEDALLIIGRQSGGEECDRHLDGDFVLTGPEKELMAQVCGAFPRVAVVLNVNGLLDMTWLREYPSVRALIFLGIPGEEGPAALAEILTGKVNPSGKMAVTVAEKYEDYPAWEDFSWNKDNDGDIRTYRSYGLGGEDGGFREKPATAYREDILLGYRGIAPGGDGFLFPFGFGLSYTEFRFGKAVLSRTEQGFSVASSVTNTGKRAGKETAQLYLSACGTAGTRPWQELKGFCKVGPILPGETAQFTITVPWKELACYSEEKGAWIIEAGTYVLRLGNSSQNTEQAGSITVEEEITVFACGNRLSLREGVRETLSFRQGIRLPAAEGQGDLVLTAGDVAPLEKYAPGKPDPALKDYSVEELAALCVGYGPGTPFAAFSGNSDPSTIFREDGSPLSSNDHPTGYAGYVSPAMEHRGISSIFYKDGPAGVGHIAWPTEMLMACSFDRELCRAFGDAVGSEAEREQVDFWLAPAVNLHRNPLGGRNFEYYSEDPFLSGELACAVAQGCQENHPVLVCAKHFAANEQETYRRGSAKLNFDAVDSLVSERALRELYLRPFEMLVRSGCLHGVMTSFNKINGVFAGGSRDLCTHILREEWGFDGVVVTDWGDMDTVVDGADAAAAGNDVVMPGGPPVIRQVLQGYKEGRVTRRELELAVTHLLSAVRRFGRYSG